MSTSRIRRKGPDGTDIIRDVDLGPAAPYDGSRAASGVRGAVHGSSVGQMQPTDLLKSHRRGGGWAAHRALITDRMKQRPGRPSREPPQGKP